MATTLPFKDLAQEANQFMTGQAIAPYLANLPNYANMVGQRTENIGQQLKGQLPQDVVNQITQRGAERGIATGSPGSDNANAAFLKALGLNSLQMQQMGNQNLSGAISDTPIPQLFNPMSLAVPQMQANQELTAGRLGRALSAPKNAWGVQSAGVAGGGAGGGLPPMVSHPSTAPGGIAMAYGPGGGPGARGGGLFSSSTFSGGMFTGAGGGGAPGGGMRGGYGGVGFSTPDFDPTSYLTAYEPGGGGGSVDWSSLFQDPNLPADWENQDWGGAFNEIDARNPNNAFMFE